MANYFYRQQMANLLQNIMLNETNYSKRYILIMQALKVAKLLEWPCGIGYDPNGLEGFRIVIYIVIADTGGQLSWHMPEVDFEWDGHTTEEKNNRINVWLAQY